MDNRERLECDARDAMAEVCRLYGIPTTLGAAWGLLFASPHPSSLSEVAAGLGVAKSTASATLKRLEHLRLVRRRTKPGDRNDYFEPVTDPMAVLRDWLERFVRPELTLGDRMHDQMLASLHAATDAGDYDERETEILSQRLAALQMATATTRHMLEKFLETTADRNEKK